MIIYDKSRMVTLKLDLLQGNMLDLILSFILNDGMMSECETKIFIQNKHGINSE